MPTKEKLDKYTFRYIESEIYAYQDTLKRIDMLRYQIIHETTNNDDENVGAGSNSVRSNHSIPEQKATSLLTDKRLQRMQEKAKAIQKVYDGLLPEKQEVIKLYYWDRPGELTWEGVATKTNTSRATALRWRKQFVCDVAKELGEM